MKDETRKQVHEFYAGLARLLGFICAVIALWSGGLVVTRLLSAIGAEGQPIGGALLAMLFSGVVALLLLSVRAERPRD
jgi:TRAP-type C4-dicarboxylate transport system permease small subunit